jgi:hypothetical protein
LHWLAQKHFINLNQYLKVVFATLLVVAFSGATITKNQQIVMEVVADYCTDVYYETYK